MSIDDRASLTGDWSPAGLSDTTKASPVASGSGTTIGGGGYSGLSVAQRKVLGLPDTPLAFQPPPVSSSNFLPLAGSHLGGADHTTSGLQTLARAAVPDYDLERANGAFRARAVEMEGVRGNGTGGPRPMEGVAEERTRTVSCVPFFLRDAVKAGKADARLQMVREPACADHPDSPVRSHSKPTPRPLFQPNRSPLLPDARRLLFFSVSTPH